MLTHLTQNTDPKYGNGHLGVNISLLQKKCVILKNSNALDFLSAHAAVPTTLESTGT